MRDAMQTSELVRDNARFVNRSVYRDQEIFELEQRAIFSRSWIYVAHESELRKPGDFRTTTIAGQPVVAVRDREERVRVFFNTCTHRGAVVARTPRGNCRAFQCMYHAWTYDLSGKLIGVPRPEGYGPDFNRGDYGLREVKSVATFCGLIFASLDPHAEALETFLGRTREYIREACEGRVITGVNKTIFNGNWKIYRENFADGYHPNYLHKLLAAIGTYAEGSSIDLGAGHGLLEWAEIAPKTDKYRAATDKTADANIWIARLPKDKERVLTLFPNLSIPWILDAVSIHVITPLSPERTLLEIYLLGGERDTPEIKQWRLAQSMMWGPAGAVGVDDIEVPKECQRGLRATELTWVNLARGNAALDRGDLEDEQ